MLLYLPLWVDPCLHPSEKPALRQLKFTHLSHALADDVEVIALWERDHVVNHSPARRIPRRNLRILLLGEEPAQQAHSLFVSSVADTDPNPSDPYVFGPPLLDLDPDPLVRGLDPVLRIRIRIRRIRMFLGLLDLDPDPLVRGLDPTQDPDPSIIKQK